MNPDMNHTRNIWIRFAAGAAACSIFSFAALAQDVTEPPLAEPPLQSAPERDPGAERVRAEVPEATRWLLDSAKALNQARAIEWTVTHRTEGNLPVQMGSAEARVKMLKPTGQKYHWIMRATGSGKLRGGDEPRSFDVAWYLEQTQYFDTDSNKVLVRTGRINDQLIRTAESVKLKDMFGPTPWNDQLEQADSSVFGDEVVNGVACKVIDFKYRRNSRTGRLWIGNDDKLPRRFAQYVSVSNAETQFSASIITEFSNVKLEPALTMADMEIIAPSGVERESLKVVEPPSKEDRRRVGITPPEARRAGSGDAEPAQGESPARDLAPAFSLKSSDGSTVTLESLRGNVVVLDFWGTWSIPCKQSGPEVQKLHEQFQGQPVKVLGLAVREKGEERPIAHFKDRSFTYTLLLGADEVAATYGVRTFPTFVVIGADGELLHKQDKYVQGETLTQITEIVRKQLGAETVKPVGG